MPIPLTDQRIINQVRSIAEKGSDGEILEWAAMLTDLYLDGQITFKEIALALGVCFDTIKRGQ